MTVKQLIEALMALDDLEMPIGSTNYYGDFGPVTGLAIETASDTGGGDAEYEGKKVVIIHLALDMQ